MRVSVRVDGRGLDGLARRLEYLGTSARRELVATVPAAVEEAIAEEFSERRDPDGKAWRARKAPTGSWPLLRKTGAMYGGRRIEPTADGCVVTFSGPAKYHQSGTRRMVARRILPDGAGRYWREKVLEHARRRLAELMTGEGARRAA
jgi:hypothetical protein